MGRTDAPRILSVNVGRLERVIPGKPKRSGIYKHAVGSPVLCDAQGLVGDAIGNTTHHGGPDQAVYLYSADDLAWWTSELGRPCTPGMFGENLTIDRWWLSPRVGDRVQWGDVLLELTAPRIPCNTLATRMGDAHFVQRFAAANRGGAYARVLRGGVLESGMAGTVTRGDPTWPAIDGLFALWFRTPRQPAPLIDALRAPVAVRLRETFSRWASESAFAPRP